VPERIFAVLYVSIMGLTRCCETTVFLHLLLVKMTADSKLNLPLNYVCTVDNCSIF